jgi:hypothetical protein
MDWFWLRLWTPARDSGRLVKRLFDRYDRNELPFWLMSLLTHLFADAAIILGATLIYRTLEYVVFISTGLDHQSFEDNLWPAMIIQWVFGAFMIAGGLKILVANRLPTPKSIWTFVSGSLVGGKVVPDYLQEDPLVRLTNREEERQKFKGIGLDVVQWENRLDQELCHALSEYGIKDKLGLYDALNTVDKRIHLAEKLQVRREMLDAVWLMVFVSEVHLTADFLALRYQMTGEKRRQFFAGTILCLVLSLGAISWTNEYAAIQGQAESMLDVMDFLDFKRLSENYRPDVENIRRRLSARLDASSVGDTPVEFKRIFVILDTVFCSKLSPGKDVSFGLRLGSARTTIEKFADLSPADQSSFWELALHPLRRDLRRISQAYLLCLQGLVFKDLSQNGACKEELGRAITYFTRANSIFPNRIGIMNGWGVSNVLELIHRPKIDFKYITMKETADSLIRECIHGCQENSIGYARGLNNQCDIAFDMFRKVITNSVDSSDLINHGVNPGSELEKKTARKFVETFNLLDSALYRFAKEPFIYITRMQAFALLGEYAIERGPGFPADGWGDLLNRLGLPRSDYDGLVLALADSSCACMLKALREKLWDSTIFDEKRNENFLGFFRLLADSPNPSWKEKYRTWDSIRSAER